MSTGWWMLCRFLVIACHQERWSPVKSLLPVRLSGVQFVRATSISARMRRLHFHENRHKSCRPLCGSVIGAQLCPVSPNRHTGGQFNGRGHHQHDKNVYRRHWFSHRRWTPDVKERLRKFRTMRIPPTVWRKPGLAQDGVSAKRTGGRTERRMAPTVVLTCCRVLVRLETLIGSMIGGSDEP